MKKVLILPSTTGQGDLSIAITLASALKEKFSVATAYFAGNAHSPLLKDIHGEHLLFSAASHPDHSSSCETQLLSLAEEIRKHSPDVVISLNESFFALASFLAEHPVVQLTHVFNRGLIRSSRWIVQKAIANSPSLPRTLSALKEATRADASFLLQLIASMTALQKSSRLIRAIRKIRRSISPFSESRLRMELVSRYGHIVGTSYLSQLFSDSLIIHSIFPSHRDALSWVSADRMAIGNAPALFTSSIPHSIDSYSASGHRSPKVLLITFGGIDHPITSGMERLLRLIDLSTEKYHPFQLEVLIAGRVTATKRDFFENTFRHNSLFTQGAIKLVGSVDHSEHMRLIEQADIVMTQPGYSTICELVTLGKPFVSFHGLAPYYEQYVNFVGANKMRTDVNVSRKPWLQVGEYGRFGSPRTVREEALRANLEDLLHRLVEEKISGNGKTSPLVPAQYYVEAVAWQVRRLMATHGTPVDAAA